MSHNLLSEREQGHVRRAHQDPRSHGDRPLVGAASLRATGRSLELKRASSFVQRRRRGDAKPDDRDPGQGPSSRRALGARQSLADRRVPVHDRTDDGMTNRTCVPISSRPEFARGSAASAEIPMCAAAAKPALDHQSARRPPAAAAPAVFGADSAAAGALLDLGRHGYASGRPKPPANTAVSDLAQLEDAAVAAGLGDDPIPDRFVELSWHHRRRRASASASRSGATVSSGTPDRSSTSTDRASRRWARRLTAAAATKPGPERRLDPALSIIQQAYQAAPGQRLPSSVERRARLGTDPAGHPGRGQNAVPSSSRWGAANRSSRLSDGAHSW